MKYLIALLTSCAILTFTAQAYGATVTTYGAKPNDGVSDLSAFQRALAANADVYVPSGNYDLSSTLIVPSGKSLRGDGDGSWIRGRVDFASNDRFTDLRIGIKGKAAVHNVSGANHTTFTRVQFRGGGGTGVNANVVKLDSHPNYITFQSCDIERNLGVENSAHSLHYDNVYITSGTSGSVTHHILWRGCRFGVSNGTAVGSPRFNVEIWSSPSASNRTTGFREINFEDCVFEAANDANLDYSGNTLSSDGRTPASGFSHVTGCTFKGNGKSWRWPNDITVEGGAGYIMITGCTFARGAGDAAYFEWDVDGRNVFSNNIVDGSNSVGILHNGTGSWVRAASDHNRITNNTIIAPTGYAVMLRDTASGNTVTGNTLVAGRIRNVGASNVTSPNTLK